MIFYIISYHIIYPSHPTTETDWSAKAFCLLYFIRNESKPTYRFDSCFYIYVLFALRSAWCCRVCSWKNKAKIAIHARIHLSVAFLDYVFHFFVCKICRSAASRLVHVCDWSYAAPPFCVNSWLDWETLGWLTELITTVMWHFVFTAYNI